jgi:hypothetical protein
MRDDRQKQGSKSARADRTLVELSDRTIQEQGKSRLLTLPKNGLSNLDLDPGDRLTCSIDPERGELVLRPTEEGD